MEQDREVDKRVAMPVYEYECSSCSYRFEERVSFDDENARYCPRCGGSVERVIYAVPHIWKEGHERGATPKSKARFGRDK